ncbi:cupin domain-containing protein [Massilia cavernae]|uniref:Cupin domain-containing protein n=1 Tax=Massilia cavernae TaxID=2320864 RepID=A0A418XQJ9_9BURK|nr:cupin domain-containing protein [Massilia cavernae]RJG14676.1 cupin domain-containing protein [Massilia cavernae]
MNRTHAAVGALVALSLAAAAFAQSGGIRRTPLVKADVSVPGREAVVVRAELDPGSTAGRHTHPGDEISYILEGQAELLVDGQPPRTVRAGEAIVIPAGTVHDARNSGETVMRLVGVYVVEKGKPLATPAR